MQEQDYWHSRANCDRTNSDYQHEAAMIALNQQVEYNLVALLKPKIYKDGDHWCVLYGEDLQSGVCGFGGTPYLAILNFNKAFNEPA